MYTPPAYAEPDLALLHRRMREWSFATLVTQGAHGANATHLPFLLDVADDGRALLTTHFARANAQLKDLQATDIRVAGESARFGVSEPRWGLYPLGGSAVRLVRQIPYTVAADLLLTGRHITSPEAKEIGLIGHVVPDGEALSKAHELADLIAANGPLAVQAVLKTMRDSEGKHEDECWADDARVGAAVFASNDAKEGPRAFAEKRAPEFTGS